MSAVASDGGGASATALSVLENATSAASKSELALEDECARLLDEYEGRGDCLVAQSGYLDVTGSTWGCVMQGEGWVEICLVQEQTDGTSETVVWHMDTSDVPEDVVAE